MNNNITKGKWEVNEPFKGDNRPFISEGDTIICYMVPNPSASLNNQPTMDAHAQAIASLPDIMRENEELKAINAELLKALKVLINFCSFIPKETFTESGKNDFQALLKNGTDVISKATK